VERRNNSTMLRTESNSDSSMKARRRLSYAGTLRCMALADMATPARMPMALTSCKRRPIFLATS